MVVHTYPSIQEEKQDSCKFKANLVHSEFQTSQSEALGFGPFGFYCLFSKVLISVSTAIKVCLTF